MTPADLSAIEARANAATPGPWEFEVRGVGETLFAQRELHGVPVHGLNLVYTQEPDWNWPANRTFIAAAREDVPALVAEVRRLQEFELRFRLEPRERDSAELVEKRAEVAAWQKHAQRAEADLAEAREQRDGQAAEVARLREENARLQVQLDGSFGGVSRNRIFEMGKGAGRLDAAVLKQRVRHLLTILTELGFDPYQQALPELEQAIAAVRASLE